MQFYRVIVCHDREEKIERRKRKKVSLSLAAKLTDRTQILFLNVVILVIVLVGGLFIS